jgi:hypothetical protein
LFGLPGGMWQICTLGSGAAAAGATGKAIAAMNAHAANARGGT